MRHLSHMVTLTRREREIMNALFALGNRASAEAIRVRLTDPPSDSSVRVMLSRLETKGYVKHQQDGLRYLYSAAISPAVARRTALQQVVQTFCSCIETPRTSTVSLSIRRLYPLPVRFLTCLTRSPQHQRPSSQ